MKEYGNVGIMHECDNTFEHCGFFYVIEVELDPKP